MLLDNLAALEALRQRLASRLHACPKFKDSNNQSMSLAWKVQFLPEHKGTVSSLGSSTSSASLHC